MDLMNIAKTTQPTGWLRVVATVSLLASASTLTFQAQSAFFKSAKLLSGFERELVITAAAIDPAENIVISFMDNDQVDPLPGRSNLVMKVDARGDLLWSHRLLPGVRGVASAPDGTIYVAGGLIYGQQRGLAVPADYFTRMGIPNEGKGSAYIAKLSPDGAIQSVRLIGTSLKILASGVVVTAKGEYYVCGTYTPGPAQFGEQVLPAPSPTTARNLFLVKYAANGEQLWVRAFTGPQQFAAVNNMILDPSGNLLFNGGGSGYSLYGGSLTGLSGSWLVRFSPDGEVLWSTSDISDYRLAYDGQGNLIGTGSTLSKRNPAGDVLWNHKGLWGQLAVNSQGDSYVASHFYTAFDGDVNIGGKVTIGDTTLRTTARNEMWVAKFSAEGAFAWALQSEGQDPDFSPSTPPYRISSTSPQAVFALPSGGAAVLGYVRGTVNFGDTVLDGGVWEEFSNSPGFFLAWIAEPENSRPSLTISQSAAGLRLNWPTSSGNFRLERADSPLASEWTTVPEAPVSEGDQNVVTVELGNSTRFFRLRKL